jgi:hypothetical protein
MHVITMIFTGILLLIVFLLFGRLWGGSPKDVIAVIKCFIPVWIIVAIINMCMGVFKAGYFPREEFPIF